MIVSKPDSKPTKRHDNALLLKPQTVVNVDPGKDRDNGSTSVRLIAGSPYASLNNIRANQAVAALWLALGNLEEQDRQSAKQQPRIGVAAPVRVEQDGPAAPAGPRNAAQ